MQPELGERRRAGVGRHRPENGAGLGAGRSPFFLGATTRPAVFCPKCLALTALGAAGPTLKKIGRKPMRKSPKRKCTRRRVPPYHLRRGSSFAARPLFLPVGGGAGPGTECGDETGKKGTRRSDSIAPCP